MAEAPESRTDGPSRLNQILAWVGIVAGVVFIVGAVFFSGFFVGRNSGGYFGVHGGGQWMHHPYGGQVPMGPGTTGPGGMMGPGQVGPGGPMGPGPQWPTTAPTTPSR